MTLKDAMKQMIAQAKLTQVGLAHKAGYQTVSAVSTPLSKGDMHLSTLCRLVEAAGYKVCLVKDGENPEGFAPIRIDAKEAAK